MGFAYRTVCAVCNHHWTLNVIVRASLHCPACGANCGAMCGSPLKENRCTCLHRFGDHDNWREAEDSMIAFGFEGGPNPDEMLANIEEYIAALPARPAPPDPPLGACERCACTSYRHANMTETA